MAKVTRHVHGEVKLCVVHYDFITSESVGQPCLLAGIAGRVDRLWQGPLDRLGHETLQWLGHHRVGRVGRVRDSVGGRGSLGITRVVHCLLVSLKGQKQRRTSVWDDRLDTLWQLLLGLVWDDRVTGCV